jgi:integrase
MELLEVVAETRGPSNDGKLGVYVFPTDGKDGPLSTNAFRALIQRMGEGKGTRPTFTAHGFRSSFRDWAGEVSTFPRELAEAALAHVVGDATERAYRRGDALEKRRKLMEAWASYVIADVPAGIVVPLRRALSL